MYNKWLSQATIYIYIYAGHINGKPLIGDPIRLKFNKITDALDPKKAVLYATDRDVYTEVIEEFDMDMNSPGVVTDEKDNYLFGNKDLYGILFPNKTLGGNKRKSRKTKRHNRKSRKHRRR